MHNLKEIRKDFDTFEKSLEKRSIDIDLVKLKIWIKKIESSFKKKKL